MAHHDLGGALEPEPIPREQHAYAPWELRVDALLWLLSDARGPDGVVLTVDELRDGIERLSADDYRNLGYYQKWLLSMLSVMHRRGIVDAPAVERRARDLASEADALHAQEQAGR